MALITKVSLAAFVLSALVVAPAASSSTRSETAAEFEPVSATTLTSAAAPAPVGVEEGSDYRFPPPPGAAPCGNAQGGETCHAAVSSGTKPVGVVRKVPTGCQCIASP